MTDDEVRAIQGLAEKATPGPWDSSIDQDPETDKPGVVWADSGHHCIGDTYATDDAAFIAAARTAVPQLCSTVLELRERIERLEGALKQAADRFQTIRQIIKNPCIVEDHGGDVEGAIRYRCSEATDDIRAALEVK